jgi:transcriptional regulator with XRE-family HTH domain
MRQRREKAGVSLRALAKRMCFTPSYISDLELGHRPWNAAAVERYEEALKV